MKGLSKTAFLFFTLSTLSHAVIPKICYTTVDGGEFCTDSNIGKVQVYLYNAGWCPPCNSEMAELSRDYIQFENQPVVFASLSGEGFSRGSKPDQAFLTQWKKKHAIPFIVAGKFRDFGGTFGTTGGIPYSVIVDSHGEVSKKGNLSVSEIKKEVKRLLADIENEESVDPKSFFEAVQGEYHIDSINHYSRINRAESAFIRLDPELPDTGMVSMPYCVEDSCFDSGNFFEYATTTIQRRGAIYEITLKANGKTLRYEWEKVGEKAFAFRNLQFIGPSGSASLLEHRLSK